MTINEFLPEGFREKVPAFGRGGDNPKVYGTILRPHGSAVWYVMETDGKDRFYGFAEDAVVSYGTFSLSALIRAHGEDLTVGATFTPPADARTLYADILAERKEARET